MSKITIENEEAVKRVLDNVFDNFDFEKVKKTMDALDWQWAYAKAEDGVPTLDEIKAEAARLMWDLANDPENKVIATGGFRVEKDFSDPDDPWMQLAFQVEEWESGYSELDE